MILKGLNYELVDGELDVRPVRKPPAKPMHVRWNESYDERMRVIDEITKPLEKVK